MAILTQRKRRAEVERAAGWPRREVGPPETFVPHPLIDDGMAIALSDPVDAETYAARMAACTACDYSRVVDDWRLCVIRECKAWPVDALNHHEAHVCLRDPPAF